MVCCGLICPRAQANSEWFMRTPRDACPGAQTCCASPMRTPARLANSRRTWSRRRTRKSKCVPSRWKVLSGEFRRRPTDFRTLYGLKWATSVEKRHGLPISAARFCRATFCVPSRWKVLSGEFRRRPTTLVINFRKSDRVGRRGLSEPREDFSRLLTYAFPQLFPRPFPWRKFTTESESRSQ